MGVVLWDSNVKDVIVNPNVKMLDVKDVNII